MKPTWKQHLEKISSNEKLEEQFSLLKKLNAGLERRDTERFCSQKWLLYGLLDQTQLFFQEREKADSLEHSAAPLEEV